MEFGATLRLLRTNANMSVRGLAERVGMSSAHLAYLESGRGPAPSRDRIVAIAQVLDVPSQLMLELAQNVNAFVAGCLCAKPGWADHGRAERPRADRARDAAPPSSAEPLGRLLAAERIALRAPCSSFEDAVDLAASLLGAASRAIPADSIARAILHRENESTTAVGAGVAVPHAVLPEIAPLAALVTLARPLDAPTPDDTPLRVIIALAIDASVGHTRTLARAMRLAVPEVTAALCDATTPEQVLELLEPPAP